MNSDSRKGHINCDLGSRSRKALKIERLANLAERSGSRLLEIGCGAGVISNYFGTHQTLKFDVEAVDIRDERQLTEGYKFTKVQDTSLPFEDRSFDIVLSNHVIEHVGDEIAQRHHLAELRRVLRHDGIGYLAVPNRWQLIEPHYRLAFLSWLPRSLRTPYLQMSGKGEWYDCEPMTVGRLQKLLSELGFDFCNICVAALRQTLEIESANTLLAQAAALIPDQLLNRFRSIIPTLIYTLRHR